MEISKSPSMGLLLIVAEQIHSRPANPSHHLDSVERIQRKIFSKI